MFSNSAKIQIEIRALDQGGVKAVRQLGSESEKTGKKGKKSFTSMGQSLEAMNKRTKSSISLFGKMAGAVSLAAIGYSLQKVSREAIMAASDLEEVGSKFDTVFKEQIDLANQWANELRDGYAMSRRESKQYLSSVQDLLVPMGMAANKAGLMSSQIVKLSADLGSFNNLPTAKVMDDIQSSLVGNYETMKKYGVILNATVVQEKALAMGLAKTKDELTAAHKAQAAYALMVEGSKAAIGDMARTSEGYANQMKKFKANTEDLNAMLGEKLLPTATEIVLQINEWVEANEKLIDQKIDEYVGKIASSISTLQNIEKQVGGLAGAAGAGLIGRILYGSWGPAKIIAGLYLLNAQLDKIGYGLGDITNDFLEINSDLNEAAKGIWEVITGVRHWNTGELLQKPEAVTKTFPKKEWDDWRAGLLNEPSGGSTGTESDLEKINQEVSAAAITAINAALEVARADKDILTDRLGEYRSFYGELQTMIQQTADREKQHIRELNELYKQKANIRMSTEAMVQGLRESRMDPAARYESQKSGLNKQYMMAMRMSGQEQIQALEQYKQAVQGLAMQYSEGIKAKPGLYGDGRDRYLVSSKEVIEEAISGIRKAAAMQQRALQELEGEKERQIQADRMWGDELTKTARDVAGEIEMLETTIKNLSEQIEAMDNIIEIEGVNNVSPKIDQIMSDLASLHRKALDPVIIREVHEISYVVAGGEGSESAPVEGSYASGTRWVPKTGPYWLHKGEAVQTPGEASRDLHSSTSFGDIHIHVPESAAPQRPEDWRMITRQHIIPELEKAGRA